MTAYGVCMALLSGFMPLPSGGVTPQNSFLVSPGICITPPGGIQLPQSGLMLLLGGIMLSPGSLMTVLGDFTALSGRLLLLLGILGVLPGDFTLFAGYFIRLTRFKRVRLRPFVGIQNRAAGNSLTMLSACILEVFLPLTPELTPLMFQGNTQDIVARIRQNAARKADGARRFYFLQNQCQKRRPILALEKMTVYTFHHHLCQMIRKFVSHPTYFRIYRYLFRRIAWRQFFRSGSKGGIGVLIP